MMVSAFSQNKGTAVYAYNGFKNRVRKLESFQAQAHVGVDVTAGADVNTDVAAGVGVDVNLPNLPDPCKEVRYILDMTRPYDNLLVTKGSHEQSYVWGSGLLSGYSSDGGNSGTHYLHDHLSSPIRLIGGSGVHAAMAYDEFGVHEVDTGLGGTFGFDNPFGFTGYQVDDVSGLYYAQARYYAAGVGRFVSEDPARDQLNWYGYCQGNPVVFVDPRGLYEITNISSIICCNLSELDPYNPLLSDIPEICRHGADGPPNDVLVTTASIVFTNDLWNLVTGAIRAVVPAGEHLLTVADSARGVVSGTSIANPTVDGLMSSIEKQLINDLSFQANQHSMAGAGAVSSISKFISTAQSMATVLSMPLHGRLNNIARTFFTQNNIPTTHTVVTHNGQPDTVAAALLCAQMSATHAFILEYADYFFSPIWINNTTHNTIFSMDQGLLAGSHTVDGLVLNYRDWLEIWSVFCYREVISDFREIMNNFELRTSYLNLRFMASIATATCGVMSNIPAVPPALEGVPSHVVNQTQANIDAVERHLHRTAQQERNDARREYHAARELYNNMVPPGSGGPYHRVHSARERYRAATIAYIEASRVINVQPTDLAPGDEVLVRPAGGGTDNETTQEEGTSSTTNNNNNNDEPQGHPGLGPVTNPG